MESETLKKRDNTLTVHGKIDKRAKVKSENKQMKEVQRGRSDGDEIQTLICN